MGFKSNYSQADMGNGIKPEGIYECLITKAEERTTKNGKRGLNIRMVIRNDVEQAYKNGYLFHTLWKRKEPTAADMQVGGYGFGQVMALGKAAQLPDGKDYPDLAAFLADLVGKPVRVTLIHEEYNGQKQERVRDLDPTAFHDVRHLMRTALNVEANTYAAPRETQFSSVQTAAAAQAFQALGTVSDEDLPF